MSLQIRPIHPGLHVRSLIWTVFTANGMGWKKLGTYPPELQDKYFKQFGANFRSDIVYDGHHISEQATPMDCLLVAMNNATAQWVWLLVSNYFPHKEQAESAAIIRPCGREEIEDVISRERLRLTACSTAIGIFMIPD